LRPDAQEKCRTSTTEPGSQAWLMSCWTGPLQKNGEHSVKDIVYIFQGPTLLAGTKVSTKPQAVTRTIEMLLLWRTLLRASRLCDRVHRNLREQRGNSSSIANYSVPPIKLLTGPASRSKKIRRPRKREMSRLLARKQWKTRSLAEKNVALFEENLKNPSHRRIQQETRANKKPNKCSKHIGILAVANSHHLWTTTGETSRTFLFLVYRRI